MGPPVVGYVVVQPQAVTLTTELPGRTNAYLTSDVRPQVNGIIQTRLFTEGADVHAGQALYQIDPAGLGAMVNVPAGYATAVHADGTVTLTYTPGPTPTAAGGQ